MPLDEDLTRYTAPPDNAPKEKRYDLVEIAEYVKSHCPSFFPCKYSIDEVRDILKECIELLEDKDLGI